MPECRFPPALYEQQLSTRKVWIMPVIEHGGLAAGFAQGFPFYQVNNNNNKIHPFLESDTQHLLCG